ncbi:hypothetical protein [Tabrizicola sp.]|uniref:hypothetical protein n=1 Tax=Tabrizicola sp. TaxID=2005166 RepID=UPI00286BF0E7|nr:hypothetical protein [Tabrizicola sp.]
MTFDPTEHFQKLTEASQIWDKPQFTVSEVCKITGATPKALEHFLNPARGLVRLMGDWVNPGTGKRRIFTGAQVLQIAAAYTMNHIGFPQRWSIGLSDQVARRAKARTIGLAVQTEMSIITYPMSNGDWASIPVYRETTEQPNLPVAVQLLDVDRMIDQVLAHLQAIVAGEDIPDFTVPDIVPEPNWFGPKGGQRAWKKDDAGNWLLNGLTLEETREYMDLHGWHLEGDELVTEDGPKLYGADLERSVYLADKHHSAGPAY